MATVSLADAERILAGCKAKIQELGYKMSVSVTDARGDLIAMVRTDGASWRTPEISRGKAVAAACMGVPSGELVHRANDAIFLPFAVIQGGHFIMGQGAVPIYAGGEVVGAVGASGGSPAQDEEVVRAGVAAAGLSTTISKP